MIFRKTANFFTFFLILVTATAAATAVLETPIDLTKAMREHLQCYPLDLVYLEKQRPSIIRQDVCLATIYHEMGAVPLWVSGKGPSEKAEIVLGYLQRAGEEGLDPLDYQIDKIEGLWKERSPDGLAILDTLLTYNTVKYVHDVSHGQLKPFMADPELFAEAGEKSFDPVATIEKIMASDDIDTYFFHLPPDNIHYRGLKTGLAAYRALPPYGDWSPISYSKNIHPGDVDESIFQIRQRLQYLFALVSPSEIENPMLYDDKLEENVMLFQSIHGLKVDGVIGKNTLQELNTSPAERIDQIRINMARWRWQDHDLGKEYVLVNIADFELYGYRDNEQSLRLPVIVGELQHQTPVFSDQIKYVEFNPFWNVPTSIAVKEDLPKLRSNPNYLVEKNIRLFSNWQEDGVELDSTAIDWSSVSKSQMARYKLRQDPGPANALGRMKVVFPNHYSVYMHDTPTKNLFKEHSRSFSHGCIRVSSPEQLAEFLLEKNEGKWDRETIKMLMADTARKVVRLDTSLPVHITYQTAWLDKNGRIHFNRDIYGRDKKLYKALLEK